jgi:hypothetical protein
MLRIDPVRDPLNHFDVLDDGQQCGCVICLAWQVGRVHADSVAATRPPHSPTCHCTECRPAHKANYRLQALNSRRDLWIEASFHASLHRYGPTYMEWLADEMSDKQRTMGWWANEASRHPMSFWFDRFEQAVRTGVVAITGAVSGMFSFVANYIDIEEEGGGFASTSFLFVDDIVCGETGSWLGPQKLESSLSTPEFYGRKQQGHKSRARQFSKTVRTV